MVVVLRCRYWFQSSSHLKMLLKVLVCTTLLLLVQDALSENIREVLFKNSTCMRNEYTCLNGKCISKNLFCNSRNDCGDNSDEAYCSIQGSCPTKLPYFACRTSNFYSFKCIPLKWKCDGKAECYNNGDEIGCDTSVSARNKDQEITATDLKEASNLSQSWIIKGRNADRKIRKWGLDLPRKAVALYLSYKKSDSNNTYMDEIAYELTTNFLFKIALKKNYVPTSDIASYVNAFLVACIDPRQIYVLDLVKELRKRVDKMNGTNPFALLAMCNAQEHITARDMQKLEEEFWIAQEKQRIDTMAMIVLALSCASNQQENVIDQEDLPNLLAELKKHQYRNGTVENVKTTALVMQALFASEREPDEENFDEQKAIQQILRSQEADGSFGSLSNTYYALPVLSGLSLINITTEHCPSFIRDEKEMIQNLKNQVGKKLSVKYSFWIGDDKFIQRTLTLSVPINTSFYQVMEYASGLDVNYRFEYNVRNRKPFLYSMYRFMDDPEKEMFWSLNQLTNETSGELKKIHKSPADIYPENNDYLVYWYKTEA